MTHPEVKMNPLPLTFGVQTGQQEASWPKVRDTWLELEELAFHDLWVFDHYLPTGTTIDDGPAPDGWSLLSALSQVVKRPRLGTSLAVSFQVFMT